MFDPGEEMPVPFLFRLIKDEIKNKVTVSKAILCKMNVKVDLRAICHSQLKLLYIYTISAHKDITHFRIVSYRSSSYRRRQCIRRAGINYSRLLPVLNYEARVKY